MCSVAADEEDLESYSESDSESTSESDTEASQEDSGEGESDSEVSLKKWALSPVQPCKPMLFP